MSELCEGMEKNLLGFEFKYFYGMQEMVKFKQDRGLMAGQNCFRTQKQTRALHINGVRTWEIGYFQTAFFTSKNSVQSGEK